MIIMLIAIFSCFVFLYSFLPSLLNNDVFFHFFYFISLFMFSLFSFTLFSLGFPHPPLYLLFRTFLAFLILSCFHLKHLFPPSFFYVFFFSTFFPTVLSSLLFLHIMFVFLFPSALAYFSAQICLSFPPYPVPFFSFLIFIINP